jgi:site-specific DNA recombinase
MLKAAVYARFSSDLQRATSIEDQIRVCRAAASRFGCVVLDAHVYDDEELSGATGHRPGYQALLVAAKERRFDAILVESQDRFWRNQGEMHQALERLTFWNVRVFSVATGSDMTCRTGRLVASVMGWKDEAFLADLRDKTRRGMQGQLSRGLSTGGRAYGYRSEPVHDASGSVVGYRRVIEPSEATVVRRIFELYNQGMTPKGIARRLNSEHVPPPRTSRGRRFLGWTWTTINGSPKKAIGILNNPLYEGRAVWNRSQKVRDPDTGKRVMRVRPYEEWIWTDATELRIVPQVLWEAVQARRAARRLTLRGHHQGKRPKYLLSGLLVCGECGSHYIVQSKRQNVQWYGCAAHAERGPAICTNGRMIRRERIERQLVDYVFHDMFTPLKLEFLDQVIERVFAQHGQGPDEIMRLRQSELTRALGELEHVKEAIRQGILTPTTKAMLEEAERRVAECEASLAAARQMPVKIQPPSSSINRYLEDLRGALETDTDRARRLLVKMLGKVTLRRDGARLLADVKGNLPGLLDVDEEVFGRAGAGRGI